MELILVLIGVLFGYCAYNFYLIRKDHETLKNELRGRLFFTTTRGGHLDLVTVLSAFLNYSKVKIEETGGVKIVKQ